MTKYKLIREAIQLYRLEMKILKSERQLLDQREQNCFQRFLDRCEMAHESTIFQRLKEICFNKEEDESDEDD